MVSNRRLVPLEGPNFYPTPAWGTKALLRYETFSGNIAEPCCGDGSMSRVLEAAGHQVISSDLYDWGYGNTGIDFLNNTEIYDNIVTNPPFNIAEAIFAKAYESSRSKVCLLLRTAFLESARRYETIFKDHPPIRVLVFTQRLSMYPKGYVVKGGGTTSYSWFVWDKSYIGPTVIDWIEPGLKGNT